MGSQIRLLSVIHGPAFGGAHNQARCLAGPLLERGVETIVVVPAEAESAASRLREAGINAVTTPLRRLRATADPRTQARFAAALLPDVRRLGRLIRRLEIDVVQVHGATNPHGALAAHREGSAVVWQLLDTRAPLMLRRMAMPLVARLSDVMTTWGVELARVHPGAERLGARLITVYPPVEESRFQPDPDRRAHARAQLGIEGDVPLIGTVGVLNPQKSHGDLIRAAEIVHRQRPDARFRVLGASSPAHGAYEQRLREEVRGRGLEEVFGFLDPRREVDLLIQGLDLFVLTSAPRSEGMPTAILEAMACAKPVIATDVGAVRELVDAGTTGLLVRPEAPKEVAAGILELLSNPDRARRLGSNGRRRARAEFGLERLADLHADAYRNALKHRRSRRG